MAVDIKKLFNEEIPARLAANAEAARQVGATYQFVITGDDGGEWFIDVSDSGPKAEPGNPRKAECTITLTSADFQKLMENPQANGLQLFFAGKLKVDGNQMLATKLSKLFELKAS